ncbi:annexin A4-like isoform X1 [Mya arenaria]|uniref:annexin A4-like isoform X1 n=1 Tax=Mya arenaria TaxID=6604 RepID=UPI0022E81046|nr:annexin A4-like isoform X1 [Mya arenaria]
MSNYPPSFGSFQGYGGYGNFNPRNSGPPPPPMGMGMGMGMGMSMGMGMGMGMGAFQQSAYNNQSGFNFQMNMGGGQPGFGCPAMQQMSQNYPMGNMPPPPAPPMPQSYSNVPQMQQQHDLEMQRHIYQQMGFRAPKAQAQPAPEDDMEQAKVVVTEEPEHMVKESQMDSGNDIDEEVKQRFRSMFVEELMRRYQISGTLEMVQGTVGPLIKYPEDDIVVNFYREERDTELKDQEWDPEADCEYLRAAMKGLGTDESIITHIVSTRSNSQRQRLKEMFKTMYGRDLIEDIKSELSGDYKDAILACFVSPAYYDAKAVKKAIYGLGTDELALIEILMTRTNQQIKEMKSVYGEVARPDEVTYETQIEDDLKGDTSGDFQRLLVSCAQGNRYEISRERLDNAVEEIINQNGDGTGMYQVNYTKLADLKKAQRDAKRLFEAGEDRWGTDEETFNLIFATRDFYQLRETYKQYVKITQADIRHAVDSETSGSYKKGLMAVAQSIMNRPKYFAERLVKAMKGLGTDEDTLIRIIASRSEIDMVQIKAEFLELTKKTLFRYIEHDTSFNFKKILQALVGRD